MRVRQVEIGKLRMGMGVGDSRECLGLVGKQLRRLNKRYELDFDKTDYKRFGVFKREISFESVPSNSQSSYFSLPFFRSEDYVEAVRSYRVA